jgi:hypothetical protein
VPYNVPLECVRESIQHRADPMQEAIAVRLITRALSLGVLSSVWFFVAQVAAQDSPRFTVMGVVVREEGTGLAWIGEPTYTQNKLVRVRQGDQVGPYQVVKITEDRVELSGPSGPIVVRLSATAPDMVPQTTERAASAPGSPEPVVSAPAPREPVASAPAPREPVASAPGLPGRAPRKQAASVIPPPERPVDPAATATMTLPDGRATSDPKEIRAHFEALKAQKNVPPSTGFKTMGNMGDK